MKKSPFKLVIVISLIFSLLLNGCVSVIDQAVFSGDMQAIRSYSQKSPPSGKAWEYAILENRAAADSLYLKGYRPPGKILGPAIKDNNYPLVDGLIEYDVPLNWIYPAYGLMFKLSLNMYVGDQYPPQILALMVGDNRMLALFLKEKVITRGNITIPLYGIPLKYDFSLLHIASELGNLEAINMLLSHGEDINGLNRGHTPISIAAKKGNLAAVKLLASKGAFVQYNKELKQPLEYAVAAGNDDVVAYLKRVGAKVPDRYTVGDALADGAEDIATIAAAAIIIVGVVALLGAVAAGGAASGYSGGYSIPGSEPVFKKSRVAGGSCTSDFNCSSGLGYRCIKKFGENNGICMKVVDEHGLQVNDVNTDGAGFRVFGTEQCQFDNDCPDGFRCDKAYKVCLKK